MTRFSTITCFLAFVATSSNAFAPAAFTRIASSTTARRVLLSEEDTNSIIEKAQTCAEGECSIDDVSGLIAELKDQQHEMSTRLEEIMNMVAHLQTANEGSKRKKDDIRAYVKDLLRVFDNSSGGFSATGFTGDVGDGPKTAYDALPPKKWSPPKA